MKIKFYQIEASSGQLGKDEVELIANLDSMEETGSELCSKIKWDDKYVFNNLSDAEVCVLTEENYPQYAVQYKDESQNIMWCIKTIY